MRFNFIILIFLIIVLILLLINWYKKNNNIESLTNYQKCLKKGFTKQFCQINNYPYSCRCINGSLGRLIPGLKGECLCYNNDVNQITQDIDKYTLRLLSDNLPETSKDSQDLAKYIQKDSLLKYFYPKRSWLQNIENIIPYHKLNDGSFY